jgi:hypothetical protein
MKTGLLYWIPRILAIVSILFMAMFSLDSFEGKNSLGEKMMALLMNNIPVFILIVFLVLAWKKEIIGGILFVLAFVAMAIFFHSFSGNPGSIIVISPFLVSGVLFIVHGFFSKSKK